MASEANFDQILSALLKAGEAPQAPFLSTQQESQVRDPLDLLSDFFRAQNKGLRGAFVRRSYQSPETPRTPAEPCVELNKLTSPQKEAWAALRLLGSELEKRFTERDLRRVWRKLAKELHPDSASHTRKSTTAFQSAHKAYSMLREAFKQ